MDEIWNAVLTIVGRDQNNYREKSDATKNNNYHEKMMVETKQLSRKKVDDVWNNHKLQSFGHWTDVRTLKDGIWFRNIHEPGSKIGKGGGKV